MALPALHKGAYGVNYRTNIGLFTSQFSSDGVYAGNPNDPMWDVFVGPLPFLVANGDDRPYLRESVPARRERFDQARDPGDNSLDSNLWPRAFSSWHLGAGQEMAEPLETDADIARFRYWMSGGVNPWEAGSLSLLPETAQRDTGARHCLGVAGVGVIVSTNSAGVRKYPTSGSSTQLSTATVTKITASGTRWFGINATHLEYGDLSGATGTGNVSKTGLTALHWGLDRLWLGVGDELYEETVQPPVITTPHHTFNSGTIVDIDTSGGGVYVMLNAAQTYIYVVTTKDDGTLNAPRQVAVLPRGETGNFLYGYLDRYLVIGTDKGVRIADCGDPASLPVGPLVVEIAGGVVDAVGDENYVWFTAGTTGVVPDIDATAVPGLYRMDLSRQVSSVAAYGDTAAAQYAHAADMYASTTGEAYSVTTYDGYIYFVAGDSATNSPLWQEQDTLVDQGWLETGKVSFSTTEKKTWVDVKAEVLGGGYFSVELNNGTGYSDLTSIEINVPYSGSNNIDVVLNEASQWMSMRLRMIGTGTGLPAESPTMESMTLRAIPSPKRTRYIQIPLMAFDYQQDRNNAPVGYEGFGFDRVRDLEELERYGGLVTVLDNRTNEKVRCQIEKVDFSGKTPPSRTHVNWGGIVTVTLLVV